MTFRIPVQGLVYVLAIAILAIAIDGDLKCAVF
jgi:hypothetical protein